MIRPLNVTDSEEFKRLRLETLLEDPKAWISTYEGEKDNTLQVFEERINYWSHFPGFGYFGNFKDGILTAYILISPNYWPNKKHIVNLSDFCVAKTERSMGIGQELMNFIITQIKNVSEAETVQLYVNSQNLPAINFYEKFGFKRVASIPQAVKDKDGAYQDEYIYMLKFDRKISSAILSSS